jgi:hypothetical protein
VRITNINIRYSIFAPVGAERQVERTKSLRLRGGTEGSVMPD